MTAFLMKCVVFIIVSAWSLRNSFRFPNRSSSTFMSASVLMLGSLKHLSIVCPSCLQHIHLRDFLRVSFWSSYIFLSFSKSASSLLSCLPNLQPGYSFSRFPQHHHISPPQSDWCVRHDQLKFSFSLYSFVHFLQVLVKASKLPFLAIILEILNFNFSFSSLISLMVRSATIFLSIIRSISSVAFLSFSVIRPNLAL